jgi:hypothetical protein
MKTNLKQTEQMKSAAILYNDYSIKNKYLVSVFIQNVDSEANIHSEDFEYVFEEGSLLEKRKNAIQKAQEIMAEFNNANGKDRFSSFSEAEAKKFKNYKCYSINISLIKEYENDEYVYDYAIYGDKEITYESLEVEAKFFREMNEDVKFTEIKNPEGETIEVLEESLIFILLG